MFREPFHFALLLLAAQQAVAHTAFTNFYVNGVDQGDSVCVRTNKNQGPAVWNWPVVDLESNDMACGFNGTDGVGRVCGVTDGATLTFEWRAHPNEPAAVVLDPSHMGPCTVSQFNCRRVASNAL
jgi:hypothetical protein